MERRGFLMGVGAGTITTLAGCTGTQTEPPGTPSSTPPDSDGDGVPDPHDYNPNDASIQSQQDVLTATPTPSPSPTSIPISTATPTPSPTPSPTPTPRPRRANTIQADSVPLEGTANHLVEYSRTHTQVRIYGEFLSKSYPNGADVITFVQGYPGTSRSGEIFDYHRSDSFTPPTRGATTVTVEFDSRPNAQVPFLYGTLLVPAGIEIENLDDDEGEYLCESDRLTISGGDLRRNRHPAEPSDESSARYTRESAEGCYALYFSGRSYSSNWRASFLTYKRGYIQDLNGQEYRDRRQYVYEAVNDGLADEFGTILDEEAEANGITRDRQKIEFLIDFVQNLPYVPDDVSTGFDDYTKRHVESLVDGGGDCEDSAIMLSSLLSSEPFRYGTALIRLPGHMALGVKGGDDVEGVYYEKDGAKYFYVETTGRGWGVGEIPEEYENEQAYVSVL